jgi:protein-tyrosine-phosphatase
MLHRIILANRDRCGREHLPSGILNRLQKKIAKICKKRRYGPLQRGQQAGGVNPFALELLEKTRIDTTGLRSKSWDEFAQPGAPKMDFVFTVCDSAAAEPCPFWPGRPMTAHWGVPDPAAVEGGDEDKRKAFREALSVLSARIKLLINLPMEKLDRLALTRKLEEIGKTGEEAKA